MSFSVLCAGKHTHTHTHRGRKKMEHFLPLFRRQHTDYFLCRIFPLWTGNKCVAESRGSEYWHKLGQLVTATHLHHVQHLYINNETCFQFIILTWLTHRNSSCLQVFPMCTPYALHVNPPHKITPTLYKVVMRWKGQQLHIHSSLKSTQNTFTSSNLIHVIYNYYQWTWKTTQSNKAWYQ